MLKCFINNRQVSVEEYLLDAVLKGKQIDLDYLVKLLNIPILFDNKEIDTYLLDIIDNKPVIQLVLPINDKFDDRSNVYKNSYIRKLLNSDGFLSRFNSKFLAHIQKTKVHTEDYVTKDKLWLLSHEEVGFNDSKFRFKENKGCKKFDYFDITELYQTNEKLIRYIGSSAGYWWLRSAYTGYSNDVGFVYGDGDVNFNYASNANYAVAPAVIIK